MIVHDFGMLFERTLRGDLRRTSANGLRIVLMGITFAALLTAAALASTSSAPGLILLKGVFNANILAATLFGISFFPTIISEENEEGIIDLIIISGVQPVGLLFGKAVARVLMCLLLLVLQIPLMQLASTMGGVLPGHVWQATAITLSFTLLLAGIGLFMSVGTNTMAIAIRRTTPIGILLVFGGYVFAPLGLVGDVLLSASPFHTLGELLTPGSIPSAFRSYWQTCTPIALLLICTAFLRFHLLTRKSENLLLRREISSQQTRDSTRVHGHPITWQTSKFHLKGRRTIILSAVISTLLLGAAFWIFFTCSGYSRQEGLAYCTVVSAGFYLLFGALCAVSLFGLDVRQGSLESLILLPRSTAWLVNGKLSATMLRLCFPLAASLGCVVMTILNHPEKEHGILTVTFLVLIESIVFFVFCVILAARFRWGAIPLSLLITGVGVNTGVAMFGFPVLAANTAVGVIWIGIMFLGLIAIQISSLREFLQRSSVEAKPL